MTEHPTHVWAHDGEEPKAPLHWSACGLDDVWLMSGYETENIDGEEVIIIKNLDGLHHAISSYLVSEKKLLNGKEIRFLRQQLELTQSELARLVGCDAQQIARYEKNENKISGPSDRLLRMLILEKLDKSISVKSLLEIIDEMDAREDESRIFEEDENGHWASKSRKIG